MTTNKKHIWGDGEAASAVHEVGGSHYERFLQSPLSLILELHMPFAHASVFKYICRYRFKNGVEDLDKAASLLPLIVGDETWGHVPTPVTRRRWYGKTKEQPDPLHDYDDLRCHRLRLVEMFIVDNRDVITLYQALAIRKIVAPTTLPTVSLEELIDSMRNDLNSAATVDMSILDSETDKAVNDVLNELANLQKELNDGQDNKAPGVQGSAEKDSGKVWHESSRGDTGGEDTGSVPESEGKESSAKPR